jgi:lysophospholipase L1-like esterase
MLRSVRNQLRRASVAAGCRSSSRSPRGWLRPPDGLVTDSIHPNDAGYEQLADALTAALQRLGC